MIIRQVHSCKNFFGPDCRWVLHIQIPPEQLCGSHITQYYTVATASRSTVEGTMRVYSAAIACAVASQPFVTVASEYPHSILNSTATCSSHNGTGVIWDLRSRLRNLDVYLIREQVCLFVYLFVCFKVTGSETSWLRKIF